MVNNEIKNVSIDMEKYNEAVGYYREIVDCVSKNPLPKPNENVPLGLFNQCQQYYWYYLMNEKIRNVKNVLKNYVDEENYIAKRKRKKKKSTGERIVLDITQKMYVELFVNLYNEKYKDTYRWGEVLQAHNIRKKMLEEKYPDSASYITNKINAIIDISEDYILKKPDINKTHNAMSVLKEALNTPMPTVEESVANVITVDVLKELLQCLEIEDTSRTPNVLFRTAQIGRALTDSSYHKNTNIGSNTLVFFNLKSDHNLKGIKDYMNALKDLLELYEDTKEEIAEL